MLQHKLLREKLSTLWPIVGGNLLMSVLLAESEGTVSLAIHYGRFPIVLKGYSDASWIAKNSGSNGGYVFTLGGGVVSWKSAKQTLITRSTFEAELCALDTIGIEAE
ncbi:UNVERIFIED_CONTAM: hypothetical protein Slati_2137800 [Sesamum latifolium]|uniref:Uncharacterized protein n=1 Tax=Sesamum latifolium TaxID=2727402 RepID=A0AAW2WTW0_9LAMI